MKEAVAYGLLALGVYGAVGLLFGLVFVFFLARRLDAGAATGSLGFRVMILPASAALWPLLAWRLARGGGPAPDAERPFRPEVIRRIQSGVFLLVALLVPVVAVVALVVRPKEPVSRLSGPVPEGTVVGASQAFGEVLPATVTVRAAGDRRQVEVAVTAPLNWSTAALYWAAETAPEALPPGAVFLGTLWGPSTFFFAVPGGGGHLVLVDIAAGGKVLGTHALERKGP